MTAPTPRTVPLEVLTDEEVEVLHGPATLVVQPYLAALDPVRRADVLGTAFRGLVARGIVDPPADAPAGEDDGDDVEVTVREDVGALITLRRGAPAVVCAARTTAGGQDFWYAHVHADAVLLEQVSADGLHRFAAASPDDLGDLLVDAVTHPDAADGTGPVLAVSAPSDVPPTIREALGGSLVRADLVLRTPDDDQPVLTGLLTGPGGSWTLTSRLGDGQPVRVRPVTRSALHGDLRALATRACAARTEHSG